MQITEVKTYKFRDKKTFSIPHFTHFLYS